MYFKCNFPGKLVKSMLEIAANWLKYILANIGHVRGLIEFNKVE